MEIMAAFAIEKGRDEDLAVQCALLHDVIEDTEVDYEEIRKSFGLQIAQGVKALSKDKAIPEPDRLADSLLRIREQPH